MSSPERWCADAGVNAGADGAADARSGSHEPGGKGFALVFSERALGRDNLRSLPAGRGGGVQVFGAGARGDHAALGEQRGGRVRNPEPFFDGFPSHSEQVIINVKMKTPRDEVQFSCCGRI